MKGWPSVYPILIGKVFGFAVVQIDRVCLVRFGNVKQCIPFADERQRCCADGKVRTALLLLKLKHGTGRSFRGGSSSLCEGSGAWVFCGKIAMWIGWCQNVSFNASSAGISRSRRAM